MSNTYRQGTVAKPIAAMIAAKMRVAIPKAVQSQGHAPVNVKHALKHAANLSPAAKAAFKRAAPEVKAATPHLNALAQPGRGLLSSLRHGVSAAHSLREVTRDMAKETPSSMSSVKSAFKAAASSSPAATAAFKHAGPAAPKAQKHVEALSRMQASPNPSLLSSLGHGIQAMRALRQVTKGMQKASPQPSLRPMKMSVSPGSSMDTGNDAHEGSRPGLLSTFGQSVQMLRTLHGTARTIAEHSGPENASTKTGYTKDIVSSPFAFMLIARRDDSRRSSFKDRV